MPETAESAEQAPPDGWAAHDLRAAAEAGLSRGHHLLTAGEALVAGHLANLTGPAATVYARLVGRKPLAFPRDTLTVPEPLPEDIVSSALLDLEARGLVDRFVPWTWRAELATRDRLAAGCRRLGLRRGGRRADLEARLLGRSGWDPTPWFRPRHRSLVRRLQRWATLRAWPREHDVVLERLGHVRYVPHPLTIGPGLHRDRAALLRWERVHGALGAGTISTADALHGLDAAPAAAGLSLRSTLRQLLAESAQRLERSDPGAALTLYDALVRRGAGAKIHFRRARTLEALGRPEEALHSLTDARTTVDAVGRRVLARAGRRIARRLRKGFPPEPPLTEARLRTLTLVRTGSDARPLWTDAGLPVEDAVVAWLGEAGREAVHVEGRLWRSLFALVFADAFFLDIPGALPVPRLAGPLDLGSPGFRERRPLVDIRLAQVAGGEAEAVVTAALATYDGFRVAGLHPDLPRAWLVRAAREIPGTALAQILEALLTGRSGGLPDLYVGAGAEVVLDSHPSRLAGGPLVVEVKGPGDTLSDPQRVWIDRLQRWGVAVELWEVRAD